MTENPYYQEKIRESHPEVCFARLNGQVLRTRKADPKGISERMQILSCFQEGLQEMDLANLAKSKQCRIDDILDAICLAVTANLQMQERTETIPSEPQKDEKGLLMQMVIPDRSCSIDLPR